MDQLAAPLRGAHGLLRIHSVRCRTRLQMLQALRASSRALSHTATNAASATRFIPCAVAHGYKRNSGIAAAMIIL